MQTTRQRILYVDEDEGNCFTLDTLLRAAHYEPVTTTFTSDALQIARSEPFDLHILSKCFPIGSGASLCEKLREIAPQTPIIFLPERTIDSVGQDGLRAAAQEQTLKHEDVSELFETVRRLLSNKEIAATFCGQSLAVCN